MSLQGLYGSKRALIGPTIIQAGTTAISSSVNVTVDAVNESAHFIGRIEWEDGGSHTVDTSGSSSIAWRSGASTFANAGTTLKVGIGAVDTGTGPPARASNTTDVVNYDVVASFTGGGGGVTSNAWQTSVPTSGTKTIATGDLVAVTIQMTARAGADSVIVQWYGSNAQQRPTTTTFTGAAYSTPGGTPNVIIRASDGTYGWFAGGFVTSLIQPRAWNSTGTPKEYGQLYKLPFPVKIYGLYGWCNCSADFDVVLYSDPLGTPVAEKTASIDLNVVSVASARYFEEWFSTPYTTTTDQLIGAVYKPGTSNITAYYATLGNAAHRVAHPWGTQGYGISRSTGAFSDINSSLDHLLIGLIVGAADSGGSSGPVGQLKQFNKGSPY